MCNLQSLSGMSPVATPSLSKMKTTGSALLWKEGEGGKKSCGWKRKGKNKARRAGGGAADIRTISNLGAAVSFNQRRRDLRRCNIDGWIN